jgi:hypothetical protein
LCRAVKQLEASKEIKQYGRITLYVRQGERQTLLKKALSSTGAESIAEAIFAALAAFVKDRSHWLKALEKTQGMWADDPKVEQALKELDAKWKAWRVENRHRLDR